MDENKHPMIVFTKTSPYYVIDVPFLINTRGKKFSLEPVTAICRCGMSRNKPYCDGSHLKYKFSGVKNQVRVPDQLKEYYSDKINVLYNRGVCNHNGACFNGLPYVFRIGARPWIKPDNATVDEIIELIKHCPTGALSYSIDGVRYQDYERPPNMTLVPGGPINVEGGVELKDDLGNKPECKEHYSLCRCGESRNKPFCDGSHFDIDFE
jgi:CDGSH-type Zn-finger protein